MSRPSLLGSAQLTVLAAAPIVEAVGLHLLIGLGLAGDAEAHPRHGFAARLGDLVAALLAVLAAGAAGQPAAHALERVLDAGVDLVLDRAVFRPTGGHGNSLRE